MNKYEIETLRKRMAEKERKEREYFERRAKEEMEKQRKEKEDAIAKKKKEREDADKAERHRIWKTMGQNYFNRMLANEEKVERARKYEEEQEALKLCYIYIIYVITLYIMLFSRFSTRSRK